MKLKLAMATTIIGLCSMGTAQAALVGSIDALTAGSQDTQLATTSLSPNNPETETAWVNQVLANSGETATFTTKTDFEGDDVFDFYSVEGNDDLFAFSFASTEPGYFLLKNGSGDVDTAVYKNNDNKNWGVISFTELWDKGFFNGNYDENKNTWTEFVSVSHLSEFNGSAIVPEPATLSLLALGLLGIGAARRRQTS